MRLLLWLTLVVLCAAGGDHVLAVATGVLLLACADDHSLVLRKPR